MMWRTCSDAQHTWQTSSPILEAEVQLQEHENNFKKQRPWAQDMAKPRKGGYSSSQPWVSQVWTEIDPLYPSSQQTEKCVTWTVSARPSWDNCLGPCQPADKQPTLKAAPSALSSWCQSTNIWIGLLTYSFIYSLIKYWLRPFGPTYSRPCINLLVKNYLQGDVIRTRLNHCM